MLDYLHPYASSINISELEIIKKNQFKKIKKNTNKVNFSHFESLLSNLPSFKSKFLDFSGPIVRIGKKQEISAPDHEKIKKAVNYLIPWRKGPFSLFGLPIDGEWRSDFKWDNVKKKLPTLEGKILCDLGCNNGYYMFRSSYYKPKLIIGLDPAPRYFFAFNLFQKYAQLENVKYELWGHEELGFFNKFFDIIFCMGILYHHPDPIGILKRIHRALKKNGQIIIESQGIPGKETMALFPSQQYAKVNSIWFVPTAPCLINWVKRAGFNRVNLFHSHKLSSDEQRKTPLSPFESLDDYLSPINKNLTVEGYPAPMRYYIRAYKNP